MTYREAAKVLAARQEDRIRLGLSRLRRCLRRLGDPHLSLPVIHVAGTNGKGSTCAMLESVLRNSGYKTGLYLSPHISDLRERIQVRGRNITGRAFARLIERVLKADRGRELTYFELLTCAAFLYFRDEKVEAAVLETGLGGRLDATNAVPRPLASVITSVDLDHTRWLGRTLAAIAREKAGIIKPGCPVFCPVLPAAAMRVVAGRARACGSALTVVRRPWRSVSVRWRDNIQVLDDGKTRRMLGLLGSRQGRNAALARAVLDRLRGVLPVGEPAWREGLRRVTLPGRFQVINRDGRTLIVDGAHNPEAMTALARTLDSSPWSGHRLRWIMGVMKDKDFPGIIDRAGAKLKDVVAVAAASPRALAAEALARAVRSQVPSASVRTAPDAAAALRDWMSDPRSPKTAVVCGSFYLAGAAARTLSGGRHDRA